MMSCQRCGRELLGPECLCVQNAVLRDERDQALLERDEARSDRDRFESERFHWKTTAEQAIRERDEARKAFRTVWLSMKPQDQLLWIEKFHWLREELTGGAEKTSG